MTDSAITSVEVVDQVETPRRNRPGIRKNSGRDCGQTRQRPWIPSPVQTVSSRVLIAAVQDCLKQAGDTEGVFSKELEKAPAEDVTLSADVIIVGGGGAGLAAAVSASTKARPSS